MKSGEPKAEVSEPGQKAPPLSTSAAGSQSPATDLPLRIPPILLEGDEPRLPQPATGPGRKYALGPTPPAEQFEPESAELPEAYGTGALLLTARDSHCLYTHWDLGHAERRRYSAQAAGHSLVLRVREQRAGGEFTEVHVHPDSQHWFVHVPHASAGYVAELGYLSPGGQWMSITSSTAATTPPEEVAEEKEARFATIAAALPSPALPPSAPQPMEQATVPQAPAPIPTAPAPAPTAPGITELVFPLAEPMPEWQPPGPRLEPATMPGTTAGKPVASKPSVRLELSRPDVERKAPAEATRPGQTATVARSPEAGLQPVPLSGIAEWTPAQERALAELVGTLPARQDGISSAEIVELFRRRVEQELASQAAAQPRRPVQVGPIESITSPGGEAPGIFSPPAGRPEQRPGFWFNINAELIIYGATEPDARVTIGGRPIRLRPDGSFSCRFALPDGSYELVAAASSAHHPERRQAGLKFSRCTEHQGEVGAHPQEGSLKPPAAENVPRA